MFVMASMKCLTCWLPFMDVLSRRRLPDAACLPVLASDPQILNL